MTARISALESGKGVPAAGRKAAVSASPSVLSNNRSETVPHTTVERFGKGALLPRIATGCFILVVALILRTLTDGGIVNTQVGSLLGMGYGVALIAVGWYLYSKKGNLAPVFPVFGLLLFISIIYELHVHFYSLSAIGAYVLLFIAGGVVVMLGFRHKATMTLCLATLGPCIVAMAIDFPYPYYPCLSIIFIGAGLVAYFAHQRDMCPSLRWSTLLLTIVFWTFWAFKLSVTEAGACDEPTEKVLFLNWFYPLLLVFFFMYLAFAVNYVKTEVRSGFYNAALPTIVSLVAFKAAYFVVAEWHPHRMVLLGVVAVALSVVHLALAGRFAMGKERGAPGSNTFIFAGVCLFALGSATVVGNNVQWVLPFWAVAAYSLAVLANKWESGGVRVTSYLFQAATCIVALASGVITTKVPSHLAGGLVAAILAGMSLLHYRWCRDHKPAANESTFFSWLDRNDFSAVILLLAGLVAGFCLFRLGIYEVLLRISTDVSGAFRGVQTVLINLGAVLLMIGALRKRSTELLIVAVCVALIGGVRSFILDMFGIKGIPLVLSIFSFGVVAAVGSVVSGRWQKFKREESAAAPPDPKAPAGESTTAEAGYGVTQ